MANLAALARQVSAPAGRILVISDFDGTLAEIDPDPMGARIDPGALRALRRLARLAEGRPDRLALAVLTGRAVADVAQRVRVGGVRYLGNHGLEADWLPRRGSLAALVARRAGPGGAGADSPSPAARLAWGAAAALGHPDWLFVEVKGGSVALHYRQAPDQQAAGRAIGAAVDAALAATSPSVGAELERFDGRLIVELRPAGAGGKGAAVGRLLAELAPASVLSIGDDVSDAEGFDVLRAAQAAGRLVSLNAGVHDRHATPSELLAAADVMLAAPRESGRLLGALASVLERERDPGA